MLHKLHKIFISFIVLTMLFTTIEAKSTQNENPDLAVMKLIKTAMQSRVMIQWVAKAYLYSRNDIATTKAEKELKGALKKFDVRIEILGNSLNEPKVKNLLLFIQSNSEDLRELLEEPYSIENAQEIIDLAEAISEGELSIANRLKKKLKGKVPVFKGQRYYVAQVAKYYMAYTSGIKDKNTIKQMNKTIKELNRLIKIMKAYPQNTPKMNRLMNQIDKKWKIVHQFYIDIEDSDLPLIVYETTKRLDKKFLAYAKALIKSKSQNK